MAKMKNKKNFNRDTKMSNRPAKFGAGNDYESQGNDTDSDTEESNYQAAGSRQARSQSQQGQSQQRSSQQNQSRSNSPTRSGGRQASSNKKSMREFDPSDLWDSAREFIDGNPGRATLIGAVIGGAVAGLFATERGRSLVTAAYSYARPMIADYARDLINTQSGNAVDAVLPQ